jgi:hypothetical protein
MGYIVRGPLGGLVWHHLQYILGLVKLGHDVYFLEDSDDYESCYDPQTDSMGTDPSFGLQFLNQTLTHFNLSDRWAYFDAHRNNWFGFPNAKELCATADVLLNVSGVNPLRSWCESIPRRVFVDTDPAFTQIRHLQDPQAQDLASRHNAFFTFAENFSQTGCAIPDDGFPWQPTRQPIVLDAWKASPGDPNSSWTTVMQWDSYSSREYEGRHYGMKSESFGPYMHLPEVSGQTFSLAVGSSSAPRSALASHGWKVSNPLEVIGTPFDYQQFISGSKGEFSVAKHGYVTSRSGWFSERSAAYLASGRPVVTEDTGFSKFLPLGKGLFAFSSMSEAVDALETVSANYEEHCRHARRIAEDYFNADLVLSSLLERSL